MKLQHYGRLFKKGILIIFLLINGEFIFAQIAGENLRVGKTTVKVSQGADVALTQGLSVSADALFINNGSVYFSNSKEDTLDLNTLLDGSGTYYLKGKDEHILTGNGAAISSLSIENGNTLWLKTDLSVINKLNLEDGVIDVPDGVELTIQSTDADAISFNNSVESTSFIKGTLARNTEPEVEYVFPLGTYAEGFHPFSVSNVSSSGYIGVTCQPDFYATWSGSATDAFELESVGGWKVTTAENSLSFVPALSLYDNSYGTLNGNYNIFYSANPDITSPEFSLDLNSWVQDATLTTATSFPAGTFALAKITTTPKGEDGVPVPEMVNFLVRDGTGRTNFEVPGLQNYKKVIMSVYNRFGNLVYRSNAYGNDFNCRNYRSGTYFYELTLETNEGKKVLLRNIIEIMEHN